MIAIRQSLVYTLELCVRSVLQSLLTFYMMRDMRQDVHSETDVVVDDKVVKK
jgi:hypothetical protein